MYQKKSEKQLSDAGFTLFFDVFKFEELINDLSDKFHLVDEYREDNKTKKFTYCVTFMVNQDSFKLVDHSSFYTMSGYAHRKGKLPADISEIEDQISSHLAELFEHDFEKGMSQLVAREVQWSSQNYYEIQSDITQNDPFLHSFYIDDLELAKRFDSDNLNRYLFGFLGEKINLDSNKESKNFNKEEIAEILQPKNDPLGRFPSNPDHPLSLMQQIAVNVALNDKNDISGVNGPPGTGKTTLLKDVFAELIVQQASEICGLKDRHIEETEMYYKKGKIAKLKDCIADKNIVVASSNNGAVQNIVNELPQQEKIDKQFLNDVLSVDYFTDISNNEPTDENWGTFATEGGKKTNIKKMIEIVKQMSDELCSEDFVSNKNIYTDFIKQYNLVKTLRQNAQVIANTHKKFLNLQERQKSTEKIFHEELPKREVEKEEKIKRLQKKIDFLSMSVELHNANVASIKNDMALHAKNMELLKLNMEAVKQQKPFAFWLLKIVHHRSAKAYTEQWAMISSSITNSLDEQNFLKKTYEVEYNNASKLKKEQETYIVDKERIDISFNSWKQENEDALKDLKYKVDSLKKEIKESKFKPLDLSQSYADLQQDNPWFNKQYRIEQSKLFIAAIAVRKQFLYENRKSLKASVNIWNRMQDYTIPQKKYLISLAWSWINFAIPVVSTTFASFGRMFKDMGVGSIANLFIDEAGQATPQSAIGAIFRSRRIMAVGDPAQITPVVSLSTGIIGLIASQSANSKNIENVVNGYSSVQTLVDEASQFGYRKTNNEWIGIPLWVHRRCSNPMFSISNEISYGGQMVLAREKSQLGKGCWIDIVGKSNNKFVEEQAIRLKNDILKRTENSGETKPSIYVISPFKNIVEQLKKYLSGIKDFKKTNIGTVHTFQGKEAAVVYLVLGASFEEKGAASWAVSEPNLMNVAATRAKEEFYIIGDKKMYRSLKSEVVDKTLAVFDKQ
ncbi:DEAD/DEAH box helicase [Candidatus Enterococcus courvalinii]|uniref:DNA2/NAM7 family helicase n=1 Tax=Candidatus Enterococcus courvalinii TaxID=2815329 RepID=A0ABS3HWU1_9ENTE|nr:DEAD/DEAH box helicase [Enterococcus sp. MSG2901]MBO0480929.1 DNA2/NAM7 family helicase [Enterococcus sp. MSG2901]